MIRLHPCTHQIRSIVRLDLCSVYALYAVDMLNMLCVCSVYAVVCGGQHIYAQLYAEHKFGEEQSNGYGLGKP
jgi:hypothetical protein